MVSLNKVNDVRWELAQCENPTDYFDVKYTSPPCAQGHKLKLVPIHKQPMYKLEEKRFDLSPRDLSIRLPCSDIHKSAHGACLQYVNEFDQVQASTCFSMKNKPTPTIDGSWSGWNEKSTCSAPCLLNSLSDDVVSNTMERTKSSWTFERRECSNPLTLGSGKSCKTSTNYSSNNFEYKISQSSCKNPWQLARSIGDLGQNNECGSNMIITNLNVIALFSPAPWRCGSKNQLSWMFQCNDCDSISLHVLHMDLDSSESIYIHESEDEMYRIDDVGSTQHHTKYVKIRYERGKRPGCGFAFRLSFNRAIVIPTQSSPISDEKDISEVEFTTEANLGLWGILVCSGFLLLLVVASIVNCRAGTDNTSLPGEKPHSSTQDTEIIMDESFNKSPQKIKPTAASFALAQHQLRLMKQEGQSTGMF